MLIEVFGEIINPDNILYIKQQDENSCWIVFNAENIIGDGALFFSKSAKKIMNKINEAIKNG